MFLDRLALNIFIFAVLIPVAIYFFVFSQVMIFITSILEILHTHALESVYIASIDMPTQFTAYRFVLHSFINK